MPEAIEFKCIVHPTDLSDSSVAATRHACALAERFGAELHLLYVLEDSMGELPVSPDVFPGPGGQLAAIDDAAAAELNEKLGTELPSGILVIRATRMGFPSHEIVAYSAEQHADLIVMATHGRSGLAHLLMGSIAEHVVRESPCPVMTIGPKVD